MKLPRDGVEYARITFTEDVDGFLVEVSVDGKATWHLPEPGDSSKQIKLLLRGPDAASTNGTLVADSCALWARVTDTPEIIPVQAGWVHLT